MKDFLTGIAFACGLCAAFMAYAFVSGAAPFTPGLAVLFGLFLTGCVLCLKFVRKA